MESEAKLEGVLMEASQQSQELQRQMNNQVQMTHHMAEKDLQLKAARGLALNNLAEAATAPEEDLEYQQALATVEACKRKLEAAEALGPGATQMRAKCELQLALDLVDDLSRARGTGARPAATADPSELVSIALAEIERGLHSIEAQMQFADNQGGQPGADLAVVARMMEQLQSGQQLPACEPSLLSSLRSLESLGPRAGGAASAVSQGLQRAWAKAVLARSQAKWLGWLVLKGAQEPPRAPQEPPRAPPEPPRAPWTPGSESPYGQTPLKQDPQLGHKLESMLASAEHPSKGPKTPLEGPRYAGSGNSFRDEASKIVSSFLERHDRHRDARD